MFFKKKQEPELPSEADARTVRLALIVGHEANAQGARMLDGTTEYKYNSKIADMVVGLATKQLLVNVIFRDKIGINGAYIEARKAKNDIAVELHFNAFNGNARGTLTLCSHETESQILAGVFHNHVCQAFGRAPMAKGIKALSKGDRGAFNVYSFGGPSVLLEPFFGDNEADYRLGVMNQEAYARSIVAATLEWAKFKNLIA